MFAVCSFIKCNVGREERPTTIIFNKFQEKQPAIFGQKINYDSTNNDNSIRYATFLINELRANKLYYTAAALVL
jgi:hypothetical protein